MPPILTIPDLHQLYSHMNESGKKRKYVVDDEEGNKQILDVEYIALRYYQHNEDFTDGSHCEGGLVKTIFTLLFWDIIYMDLPASFISHIQSVPLDMYTKHFYLRRKVHIDKRVKEIESDWSQSDLLKWINDKYDKHSHEVSLFGETGKYITERDTLEVLVCCIGRPILAKIYKRLVKDLREYSSGMPDLLVWNAKTKKSKFVEVKGENDKLSVGQTLWIDYLKNIGANVEVCHIHSIGSKRMKKVKSN